MFGSKEGRGGEERDFLILFFDKFFLIKYMFGSEGETRDFKIKLFYPSNLKTILRF